MAIMVVNIEDDSTLMMNEFFDFNGCCYGISRSRHDDDCIPAYLEDFYECTVRTQWVEGFPVVFVENTEEGADIIGWYHAAKIYRDIQRISLFLEGNIEAKSVDAVLLPKESRILFSAFHFREKGYEVVEIDDNRYHQLENIIDNYHGKTIPFRYDVVDYPLEKNKIRDAGRCQTRGKKLDFKRMSKYCITKCEMLARNIMEDACKDISEIKGLLEYANLAVLYDKASADGYYYQAMADEQLGFLKKGLKAIEKAISLEEASADLLAQKANLLVIQKRYKEAIHFYEEAYGLDGDEVYLVLTGKVYRLAGNVDMAYKTFQKVTDQDILESYGIHLKDMEKRWPFVAIRNFNLKNILKKDNLRR